MFIESVMPSNHLILCYPLLLLPSIERGVLIDRIWTDGAEYVDENALSVVIKRLRDKIEEVPTKPQYIKTVYGIGYKWEE